MIFPKFTSPPSPPWWGPGIHRQLHGFLKILFARFPAPMGLPQISPPPPPNGHIWAVALGFLLCYYSVFNGFVSRFKKWIRDVLQNFKCPSTDENDVFEFEWESRAAGHLLLGTWNFFSVFRCGRTQLPVVPVCGHSLLIQWCLYKEVGWSYCHVTPTFGSLLLDIRNYSHQ